MIHRTVLAFAIFCVPIFLQGQSAPSAANAPAGEEAAKDRAVNLKNAADNGEVPTLAEVAEQKQPPVSTGAEALERLKQGNFNFLSGQSKHENISADVRRSQIMTQTPFAVVLGCSDSRVPVEIVFDQGLGEIFTIRVAGNIADPATLGSIEYAVKHLDSKLLVVMGHEGCGAVAAALLPPQEQAKEPENVQYLLNSVTPSLKEMPAIRDRKARMREAVIANVQWQLAKLKENPVIAAAVESNELQVVGAIYEISSGAVDFLESEEKASEGAAAASSAASH